MPEKYTAAEFSTDRFRKLLQNLGSPEQAGFPTVQILGTDGKGSTLAFLEALLRREGKTVCSFISPHLVCVEERFRWNGGSCRTDELAASLETVRTTSPLDPDLTFFEVLNAAFWCWVRKKGPDFVLLETGLGGRLDTTTVCQPSLKILTHLDRDHIRLLGRTMDSIAREKAEALRPGVPTVIAPQTSFLIPELENWLEGKAIPARWTTREAEGRVVERSRKGWVVQARTPLSGRARYSLSLLGDHQVGNFLAALLGFEQLGFGIKAGDETLTIQPNWLARCQIMDRDESPPRVLDGSHTAMGGQALRAFLDTLFPESQPRRFAFASTRDRFPWCYLRGLVRPRDELVLVDWTANRMWAAEDLKQELLSAGWNRFDLPPLVCVPWEEEWEATKKGTVPWVGCGSFYWVGKLLGLKAA